MTDVSWTEQRIARLAELYEAGLSYAQIAEDLGGVSRNAVGGKIDRLKLPKRTVVISPEKREQTRQRAAIRNLNNRRVARGTNTFQPPRETKMQEVPITPAFIGSLNIPYSELRDFRNGDPNQCRFIAGEVTGHNVPACGNETLPGESYCGHCWEIVRNKPQPNLSDAERLRRRLHFVKIGNPSKVARTLDNEEEAA